MKKIKFAVVTLVATAILSACATAPVPTVAIGFNYEIDNAKASGIVQIFDLSGNTIVHMRNLNLKTTKFFADNNAPIQFKIVGETVALDAIYPSFTVLTATAASRVVRKTGAPVVAPPTVVASSSPAAMGTVRPPAISPDTAILAEITRMRKELADLKSTLATLGGREAVPSTPSPAGETPAASAANQPQVVIVSFPNNSGQFNPAQEQRTQLFALSHIARNINVRGFTDSDAPTPRSTALARARAEAAKRYLVSMGVAADKITVGFDGAGSFIADNGSPAGRAANRRVEIGGT